MDLTVIKPLQDRLEEHPVYAKVKDLNRLRVFMQYHVYSVWDFMSLLKALQRELAPAQTPWLPGRFSSAQRFINEIVLEEESDEAPTTAGTVRYLSHFEMYVESMEDVAADTAGINHSGPTARKKRIQCHSASVFVFSKYFEAFVARK